MITVQILDEWDRVDPEDWCRPLALQTMSGGMSDSMAFKSCYGGTPENNVKWCRVKHVFGETWYGSQVHEFFDEDLIPMEFMRGEPPLHHRLNMEGYTDLTEFRRKT